MMTLTEAAKYVKLHRNTVYKLVKLGQLPGRKVGHQWRFDQATLDAWVGQAVIQPLEKP